jgi:hypothetical protein
MIFLSPNTKAYLLYLMLGQKCQKKTASQKVVPTLSYTEVNIYCIILIL